MKTDIIRSSPAERDIARILNYFLAEDAEIAGGRFGEQLEAALAAIAALPNLGHPWESPDARDKDLRYWHVPGFRSYLVFYRITAHGILIKRVLHSSQDIRRLLSSGD
jgi:toxin ParE1/3/4